MHPEELDDLRQMVLICREARKDAERRGDQRGVDFAEERLRIVRRIFIKAWREARESDHDGNL